MQITNVREVFLRHLSRDSKGPNILPEALLRRRIGEPDAPLTRLHRRSVTWDRQLLQSKRLLNKLVLKTSSQTGTVGQVRPS